MSKEVATKQSAELSEFLSSWGAADDLRPDDILIPKILQVQKMSGMVDDYGAREGEFRDSITGELISDKDQAFDAIVFSQFQTWVIYEKQGKTKKFIGIEPVTPQNEHRDWNENGRSYVRTFNFYLLRPSAGIDEEIPYLLSMSSYSSGAAKRLLTWFMKLSKANRPSAAYVIRFRSVDRQNDEGKWKIIDWERGRETELEELRAAKSWYQQVKRGTGIRVDDTTDAPAPAASSVATDDLDFA